MFRKILFLMFSLVMDALKNIFLRQEILFKKYNQFYVLNRFLIVAVVAAMTGIEAQHYPRCPTSYHLWTFPPLIHISKATAITWHGYFFQILCRFSSTTWCQIFRTYALLECQILSVIKTPQISPTPPRIPSIHLIFSGLFPHCVTYSALFSKNIVNHKIVENYFARLSVTRESGM